MESKYEYGVGERNDGLYVIYRKIRNSNIYEYLCDRNSHIAYVPMGNGQYVSPEFAPAWTSAVGNAWTSYKGMKKEVIYKLIDTAIAEDIKFEELLNASKIKRMMDIEEFKNL
jgi:hypothetical protein